MLMEPDSVTLTHFPTIVFALHAFSAEAAALYGIRWELDFFILKFHPRLREVMGIRTWKIPPAGKYDPQIRGNSMFFDVT